ncbi:MAG: hypothetical protein KGJ07_00050 [Patescibacteria group bacterium]|nr:hypothetical protein [Patescibacteria group bacterium]
MTTLTLGPVTFATYEIPPKINFGGDQMLSVKKLVGGQRIIDAMGRDDDAISWSGLFFGSTALARARFLDGMRVQGLPLLLTWSQFSYSIVIRSFKPSFERTYQIPYSITCEVIQDLTKPIPILLPVGYNDAIQNQLAEAMDLALIASNPSVSNSLALLSVAINAIPDLGLATSEQLATLLTPLSNAQSATSAAIASLSGSLF